MDPQKILERTERCVCKLCGGKLQAKIIIYNKYGGQGVVQPPPAPPPPAPSPDQRGH